MSQNLVSSGSLWKAPVLLLTYSSQTKETPPPNAVSPNLSLFTVLEIRTWQNLKIQEQTSVSLVSHQSEDTVTCHVVSGKVHWPLLSEWEWKRHRISQYYSESCIGLEEPLTRSQDHQTTLRTTALETSVRAPECSQRQDHQSQSWKNPKCAPSSMDTNWQHLLEQHRRMNKRELLPWASPWWISKYYGEWKNPSHSKIVTLFLIYMMLKNWQN